MGFICGARNETTVKRLVEQIDKDFDPDAYCGDGWAALPKVVGANRLLVGKEWTYPMEKNNALTRQGPARFHQKTHAYSKSSRYPSKPKSTSPTVCLCLGKSFDHSLVRNLIFASAKRQDPQPKQS